MNTSYLFDRHRVFDAGEAGCIRQQHRVCSFVALQRIEQDNAPLAS
jgi:hypothetical protein